MDNKIKPHTYQLHTKDIIDLKKIFEGGQIFSWSEYSQGYMGLIDNIPFCVSYKNNTLYFETSIKEMVAKQKVIHFFDLNNLPDIAFYCHKKFINDFQEFNK